MPIRLIILDRIGNPLKWLFLIALTGYLFVEPPYTLDKLGIILITSVAYGALSLILGLAEPRKYLLDFQQEAEPIKLHYQCFENPKTETLVLNLEKIQSYKFSSKEWPSPFHGLKFKYLDKEGKVQKMDLRIKEEAQFIKLLGSFVQSS